MFRFLATTFVSGRHASRLAAMLARLASPEAIHDHHERFRRDGFPGRSIYAETVAFDDGTLGAMTFRQLPDGQVVPFCILKRNGAEDLLMEAPRDLEVAPSQGVILRYTWDLGHERQYSVEVRSAFGAGAIRAFRRIFVGGFH